MCVHDELRESVLNTYRFLRGGMVVWIAMLFVAIGIQIASAGCVEGSISAYFYTSAHNVFVASLCALAVCLLVYKGSSDTEDALLNMAGVLAFVVAFVPTTLDDGVCGGLGLPADFVDDEAVRNNLWAVIAALAAAKVISWWIYRNSPTTSTTWGRRARRAFWVTMVVGLVGFVGWRELFIAAAHFTAAVVMFLAITGVVWINGEQAGAETAPRRHRINPAAYKTIAILMVAVILAAALAAVVQLPYWVLVVELLLIIVFAVFWILQTIDLWNVLDRTPLMDPGTVDRRY